MVYKFFDKKSAKGRGINKENLKLDNELHKPIIRKIKKRKVYSSFKDNIWGVDLADLQVNTTKELNIFYALLICFLNMILSFLLSFYRTITNAFENILYKSKRKPNKIWVDQGSEFYNNNFKKWLKNDITMYSTHNEGKSVVAERFIKSLKNKIYKLMTAISKNVYFDVLDDIVKKYNNTYHNTIKMKPINVKDDNFTKYIEESNEKDPKFKMGDHVRISKYKNIFANWSEETFIVNKVKNAVPWTYEINDLNRAKILGSFYEKELQKTNQKEFRIEKVIKRKENKFYVKWKGYDNSFNSSIDKKGLIK